VHIWSHWRGIERLKVFGAIDGELRGLDLHERGGDGGRRREERLVEARRRQRRWLDKRLVKCAKAKSEISGVAYQLVC